jgi:hypothetical protein
MALVVEMFGERIFERDGERSLGSDGFLRKWSAS